MADQVLVEATTAVTDTLADVRADLLALREHFPASQTGVLPQPYRKDAEKGTCKECGKWHGLPAMHLDFVGHAAVTERLLDVDPFWNWEPFALGADGLPALDRHGNLWIRLTVCGMTRIGVGDGPSMKVLIGDAIRNASMRFGVALYLWVRGTEDDPTEGGETIAAPAAPPVPGFRSSLMASVEKLKDEERSLLREWLKENGLPDRPSLMDAEQAGRVAEYLIRGLPLVEPSVPLDES